MSRQTFILIVVIYGFLLGLSMTILPDEAVKFFGGEPKNITEVNLMRFFGFLHLGFNFTGLTIRKSNDSKVVKAYLLGLAIVLFGSLGSAIYAVYGLNIPIHNTAAFDWSLWGVLGLVSLYFWNQES
ncbi:MAG: hypothetical protein MUF45_18725 [Spirosomaceae bacterium]|jgi:hypothetical protein|nr:hypothetical protein [Spirosomataceae bacterium]